MFGRKKPEVLVVGAGPVGLMAALVLAKRGVRVQIIDEAWRPTAHAYALALHPEAMDFLEELGLAARVLESAHRVQGIGVYDGPERRTRVDLTQARSAFPFVTVLRQSALEDLFAKGIGVGVALVATAPRGVELKATAGASGLWLQGRW
jgi:2-polyprenyl-6-methoxyphenol hydroxylase-like FAD-dependent oxidoreductase